MTKLERQNLLNEQSKLEKKVKNSDFIDPKDYRRLNEIISLLLTDGKSEDINFKVSNIKNSNRVTSFNRNRT
jgi:hypothetical protein